MLKILFAVSLTIVALLGHAQPGLPFTVAYDHQALQVRDLDASARFYQDILGLPEIQDAANNPDIRWFELADGRQLHLITNRKGKIRMTKTTHYAIAVSDFDAFVQHLKNRNIPYSDWPGAAGKESVRPDGIRQVYIQDPDGYWIEVNDVK